MKTNPPQKDKDVTYGTEYSFHPYGDGAMTAISAAKVGGDCVFCTKLGADTYGERLKSYYKACGLTLSTEALTEDMQTGMSVTIYSDADNGHTYVTKGVNQTFSKEDVDRAFAYNPDMFVLPQDNIITLASEQAGTDDEEAEDEEPIIEDTPIEDDDLLLHDFDDDDTPLEETTMKLGADGEIEDFSQTISFSNDAPTEEVRRQKKAEPRNIVLYAARLASKRHIDMIVQYNEHTAKLPLSTLDGIKILVISDKMLQEISGIHQTSIDKTLRALIPLATKIKAKYYIVQQGNDTSFVYDGNYYETVTLPASLKLRAKQESPCMHGTYIGALATRFLKTRDIIDACKFACVASILTQSKFGCLDHAPSFIEIADFTAGQ